MNEEKILDRVRKLLALANDERGNETERETALRQAHAMLSKHGLDLAAVEAHEREKLDPRGRFQTEGWSMGWTRQVRQSIARLFMCVYVVGGKVNGTKERAYFIGRESNATTAMYMSTYVIENILKEGRRLYKHNLSPETRSFAQGCASRLRQRVHEMIAAKAKEADATPGNAIALVALAQLEEDANREFMSSWATKTMRSRSVAVDSGAYAAGRAHGDRIGLNLQMAKPATLQLR